ncbi:MAG: hypothetical protein JWP97_5863 [Labilithrix sp.]|nr:hypothetical protein [Labilithrix sp.]
MLGGMGRVTLGDYALGEVLGRGGMSTVLLGLHLPSRRFVAVKRLLPHVLADPDLCDTLVDEARLTRGLAHPNVAAVRDVIREGDELALVMDVVEGASLAALAASLATARERMAPAIASAIAIDVLAGLGAAHDACDEHGAPLHVVHRDVSPANILVGSDGRARIGDFGVAKALGRLQQTREGAVKGKLSYMAPEQVLGEPVTRTADVFASSIVLWELLAGERLFAGASAVKVTEQLLYQRYQPLRERLPSLPPAIDVVLARGLARRPDDRYPSASALGEAVGQALPPAPAEAVAALVASHGTSELEAQRRARAALTGHSNESRRPGS